MFSPILSGAALIFLASAAQAQIVGEVKEVNLAAQEVTVELSQKGVNAGALVFVPAADGSRCELKVLRVNFNTAVASPRNCAKPGEIRPGLVVKSVESIAASPPVTPAPPPPSQPSHQEFMGSGTPTINESWYTLWGLGFSAVSYQGKFKDLADNLDAVPGVDHSTPIDLDMFGFYWPLNGHRTMMGVVMNGVSESWSVPGESFTLAQYLLAFSTHHFFGANIGDGWFIRGDIGRAWYSAVYDGPAGDFDSTSDPGIGLLAGGGYALALGNETRLLIGLYLASRNADGDRIGSVNLNFGFLF